MFSRNGVQIPVEFALPTPKKIEYYAALAPPVETKSERSSNFSRACSTNSQKIEYYAALAQLVEQGTENPCVLGSIPRRGTTIKEFDKNSFFCDKM